MIETTTALHAAAPRAANHEWVGGRILDDLGGPPAARFAGYVPAFGFEPAQGGRLWITDHGQRIALFDPNEHTLDLFEFLPGRQRLRAEVPPLSHAPTLLGARITTVQWLGPGFGRSSDELEVERQVEAGSVSIIVTERWLERGFRSRKELTVRVDSRFGYIVHTVNDISGGVPIPIEFANFLAAGLSDARPGKDRFPYLLWRHPELGALKWRSNMVSLRSPGQVPVNGRRDIAPDGWLGFFGEDDWNPVFALNDANVPLRSATCDNLLDEHLTLQDNPPRDIDGTYNWHCEGSLFNCPADLANRLIEHTPFNDLGEVHPPEGHSLHLAPFVPGTLSDFETAIPLESYFRGCYWPTEGEMAQLGTHAAHSGRRSMELRFAADGAERTLHPIGSSLWLNSGRRYRLSAWFHHAGDKPARVRLTARQIYFQWSDRIAEDEVALELCGDREWTPAQIEFKAVARDPAVLVGLHWSGAGGLHVDDVLLEELTD